MVQTAYYSLRVDHLNDIVSLRYRGGRIPPRGGENPVLPVKAAVKMATRAFAKNGWRMLITCKSTSPSPRPREPKLS